MPDAHRKRPSNRRTRSGSEPATHAYEKLGLFYLGRPYDLASGAPAPGLTLYDSKDLTTHAVCVGMTGSGKTGLGLGLIEEAAIDGIPVLAIDPKGDLGNLLLTFPELSAGDFRPWVNADEAERQGMTADEYAADRATRWRAGLAEWHQDGDRIRRLRESADFSIYTPGSNAGLPISILSSFAAPPAALQDDVELLAERINTTATSLLTLAGIDAEPVRSREHVLVATVLRHAWRQGRDLDLTALIQQIQQPPVKRVGVLDLDAFYPPAERFELAMRINQLLAAPGFELWLQGEPLDVDRLLYTEEGKPRVSIVSIAHLGETERMSFVALLLNQVLGWMRSQPGTNSLRAMLYMDEIFGYFPPVANPPAKAPLLTLLKQARAYGLGVVLATQNPVDLDYKGLSNTGTWFLGRLQTERDKARVLDGLEGVATGSGARFDRGAMEETLAGLSSRVFLMHNVHEEAPVVFETRWVMSYMRGPLTREQIRTLMADRKALGAPADTDPLAPPGHRAGSVRRRHRAETHSRRRFVRGARGRCGRGDGAADPVAKHSAVLPSGHAGSSKPYLRPCAVCGRHGGLLGSSPGRGHVTRRGVRRSDARRGGPDCMGRGDAHRIDARGSRERAAPGGGLRRTPDRRHEGQELHDLAATVQAMAGQDPDGGGPAVSRCEDGFAAR